ncbi:MAG TPA: DUF2934 domain-containing protein, partial [Candidatus Synoicihabitans sp.]|nr:DUF2934 domain-containing protein [Candidatus Synoicihabitans sp.]
IAQRAREIWQSRGQPTGEDLGIWLQAERELSTARSPAAAATAPTAPAAPTVPPPLTAAPRPKKLVDSPAVEPTATGVAKAKPNKSLRKKVDEALAGRGGIGQGGNARIDPTT